METKQKSMSITERKQFSTFIESRRDSLLKTISDEMGDSEGDISETLLMRMGVASSSKEIETTIEHLESELDSKINESVEEEKSRIEIEELENCELIDIKINELKVRFNQEKENLSKEKDRIKAEFEVKRVKMVDELKKTNHFNEINKISELKIKQSKIREIELQVSFQVKQRMQLYRKCKSRLESTISQYANDAAEKLITIDTREEAVKILESIPKINEIIGQLDSPDGINAIMKRFDPQMSLPFVISPQLALGMTAAVDKPVEKPNYHEVYSAIS